MLPLYCTFDEHNVKMEKELNIVFPGNISKEKGLDYIIKMNNYIHQNNLPINLIILGEIYPNNINTSLQVLVDYIN